MKYIFKSDNKNIISYYAVIVCLFIVGLDITILSTSSFKIASDIGDMNSFSHLSLLMTSYLLLQTAAMPIYGKLSDIYGRKPLLLFSLSIFGIGSLLCGISNNFYELIFFRAIQGIGGGGLVPLPIAAVGDIFKSKEKRIKYQSYLFIAFSISSIIGPFLGGFFVHLNKCLYIDGWRWIFYINLPIVVLVIITLSLTFPSKPIKRSDEKIDYLGATLITLFSSGIILTLQQHPRDWFSLKMIIFYLLIIALLVLFIRVEINAKNPIVPINFFKNKSFCILNILCTLLGFQYFSFIFIIPLMSQVLYNNTPIEAGFKIIPMGIGILIVSIFMGKLYRKFNKHYQYIIIIGFIISSISSILIEFFTKNINVLFISSFIFGIGFAISYIIIISIGQIILPEESLGVSSSSLAFFRYIGGVFGSTISNLILNTTMYNRLSGNKYFYNIDFYGTPNINTLEKIVNKYSNTYLPRDILFKELYKIYSDSFLYGVRYIFIYLLSIVFIAISTFFLKRTKD